MVWIFVSSHCFNPIIYPSINLTSAGWCITWLVCKAVHQNWPVPLFPGEPCLGSASWDHGDASRAHQTRHQRESLYTGGGEGVQNPDSVCVPFFHGCQSSFSTLCLCFFFDCLFIVVGCFFWFEHLGCQSSWHFRTTMRGHALSLARGGNTPQNLQCLPPFVSLGGCCAFGHCGYHIFGLYGECDRVDPKCRGFGHHPGHWRPALWCLGHHARSAFGSSVGPFAHAIHAPHQGCRCQVGLHEHLHSRADHPCVLRHAGAICWNPYQRKTCDVWWESKLCLEHW